MNQIDIKQYGFPDAKLYSYKYPKAEELNPILHDIIIDITNEESFNHMEFEVHGLGVYNAEFYGGYWAYC